MTWKDVYPRPQLRRENWQSLDGEWMVQGAWTEGGGFAPVPSCRTEEEVFCSTSFDFERTEDVVLLHFEAADQIADVKLNGTDLGIHSGGYLPFEFDISDIVIDGVNTLEVHIVDKLSHDFPYGKQRKDRGGMWYTPMSGLWQSVWIEQVPKGYIRSVRITPDLEGATVELECPCEAQISLLGVFCGADGKDIDAGVKHAENGCFKPLSVSGEKQVFRVRPEYPKLWTPDAPYLYRAKITAGRDSAEIYFGLRTVSIESIGGTNRVCLNGKPIFLHGVLDQGYFTPGLMLPDDPAEYERDILRMKELGFNLLRKHIKIEPRVFYYDCDRLGILVMQDMVNSGDYSFLRDTALATIGIKRSDRVEKLSYRQEFFIDHCEKTVQLLYNHPSIVAWTIFNEGWGQFNSDELYGMFKEWDSTRLIDSTSGWFMQQKSDFDSRHIYFRTPEIKEGGKGGRPLFISECGGYSFEAGGHGTPGPLNPGQSQKSYGYGKCKNSQELTDRICALYEKMILPAIKHGCCGCIYTQLSDIQDEINGLYTYDRSLCKVEKERLKAIAGIIEQELKNACGSK